MNVFEAGVIARLKEAGLLDIAERVAKREGLKLAACIAPGEITGAHVALWVVLCKHASPRRVADLVAFPEEGVLAALREALPQARLAPPPASGARPTAPDVGAQIEAAVAPLRRRVEELEAKLASAHEDTARREQEIADLACQLKTVMKKRRDPKVPMQAPTALTVDEHLARFGDAAAAVREAAARSGVPLEHLLTGRSTSAAVRAKNEIVRVLTRRFAMSQPEIGNVLRMDPSSIRAIQRRTGVVSANRGRLGRAAA